MSDYLKNPSKFGTMVAVDEFGNEDLITQILLWLPLKSLIIFKVVCKQWYSIISNHSFSHLYAKRNLKLQSSLLLRTRTSEFFYFNDAKLKPYHFTLPNPKILSSCNGLMMLKCDRKYYVFNPTTSQSRILNLTPDEKYNKVLSLNIAFDPRKSPHYKIVCVRTSKTLYHNIYNRCCQIELYDSERHTWRLCLKTFIFNLDEVVFSSGVYWNNLIHWRVNRLYYESYVYFDIDKSRVGNFSNVNFPWNDVSHLSQLEKSREVCQGETSVATARHSLLVESHDNLYHFMTASCCGETFIVVFELQSDYSGWLYSLEHFGSLIGDLEIFSFQRGEGDESSILIFHVPGKIMAYKLVDKSFVELVDLKGEAFYEENKVQFEDKYVYQFNSQVAT